jgi:hypothetical protein
MARLLLALSVVLLATVNCQGLPDGTGCVNIPDDGCPLDRGGSCADPTCNALWSCTAGAWSLVQECNQPDGGAGGGSGAGGGISDAGASDGPCVMANINLVGQTQDCTPDLAFPDCPVSAALGCADQACLTGCSDFWLCSMAGWVDVAYCTCDGQLIVTN